MAYSRTANILSLFFSLFLGMVDGQVLKHNVIVLTPQHGNVEGFTIPSQYEAYDKNRINVFLGIPYAKRPEQYSDWRRQFRFNVSKRRTSDMLCIKLDFQFEI